MNSSVKLTDSESYNIFCKILLAFFLLTLISMTKSMSVINKFPVNFLFYFFLGISIKLRFLKSQNKTKN